MSQSKISAHWTLKSFRAKYDEVRVTPPMTNSETGEEFRSVAFIKDGQITLVGFSSKLGELTPAQIKAQIDDLQVVKLESGSLKLCKKIDLSKYGEKVDI